VPIDEAAYQKYKGLPDGPLRTLIDASILLSPDGAKNADGTVRAEPASFARIRMTGSNQCPLLTEDRLCRIQTECGEASLSATCGLYPRIAQTLGGRQEWALTLSCPEAARLVLLNPVLLNPDPLALAERRGIQTADDGGGDAPFSEDHRIREIVLALVRNRAYPLWQRLFLLGIFCRRLDAIARGELKRNVPAFLSDFESAVASGTLNPAMETLPLDRSAQLDAVLRLAGMLLHRSNVRPRFVECIRAFTTGIGNGPGATLESLTAHYALAHDRYYASFFERHPHILENFLINAIIRRRFPFGPEGIVEGAPASMTREFAMLTAQFALMKGLLIGVAGCHREGFSTEHVVHTVQAAGKHFEHHPEFLKLAHELLLESGLDGARGTAILLRNSDQPGASPAKYVSLPTAVTPGPRQGEPSSHQSAKPPSGL
jgi:lysine-N-methylase